MDQTAWRADVDFNAPSKIGKLLAQILLFYRGTSDRAVVCMKRDKILVTLKVSTDIYLG